MSKQHALPVGELKTMFPIKCEPSDTSDVGNDPQPIRYMDDNPNICDTSKTNTSDNRPDKSLSEGMLLTVAYVKNESTSNAQDFYDMNSEGNKEIHGEHLMDINVIKTEKTDTCSDNNSRDVIDDENVTVHVKEESQHPHFQEQDIHHVTDIAQYSRVGERDTRDMGDDSPSSASQPRNEAHKCIHKRVHSGNTHFKCDECAYNTTKYEHLKTHKLIHSGEKPYKCDECAFSTTRPGLLKTHKLIHSGERPYKCDVCEYSARRNGTLKIHKLKHTEEKSYKCDECDYSATRSGDLKTHKLIHSGEIKCN